MVHALVLSVFNIFIRYLFVPVACKDPEDNLPSTFVTIIFSRLSARTALFAVSCSLPVCFGHAGLCSFSYRTAQVFRIFWIYTPLHDHGWQKLWATPKSCSAIIQFWDGAWRINSHIPFCIIKSKCTCYDPGAGRYTLEKSRCSAKINRLVHYPDLLTRKINASHFFTIINYHSSHRHGFGN